MTNAERARHTRTEVEARSWSTCGLDQIAGRFGTPVYVIDRKTLERSSERFVSTFRDRGVPARTFFSVKTNPVPAVMQILADAGIGAEVRAMHELRLAKGAGLTGPRIVVNGTVKPDDLLAAAVAEDVGLINVESVDELRRLEAIAGRLGKRPNVGLRVNPGLGRRWWDFSLSTGSVDSPMGFLTDTSEWTDALQIPKVSPSLQLIGIHCHIGTSVRSAKPYRNTLDRLFPIWRDLWDMGLGPSVLDLGGGFNVPKIRQLTLLDAVRQFALQRGPRPRNSKRVSTVVDDVADLCRRHFDRLVPVSNQTRPELFLEPGRALCATSQTLLLRVQRLVDRSPGPVWALCDGGAMSLSPLLVGEYHDIVVAGKENDSGERIYNLLGSMPTPLDLVSPSRKLPQLEAGDVIAILDVGAYFTSLSNTFAGPRPAVVLLDGQEVRLIRRRETFEDLFERDAVSQPIRPST